MIWASGKCDVSTILCKVPRGGGAAHADDAARLQTVARARPAVPGGHRRQPVRAQGPGGAGRPLLPHLPAAVLGGRHETECAFSLEWFNFCFYPI